MNGIVWDYIPLSTLRSIWKDNQHRPLAERKLYLRLGALSILVSRARFQMPALQREVLEAAKNTWQPVEAGFELQGTGLIDLEMEDESTLILDNGDDCLWFRLPKDVRLCKISQVVEAKFGTGEEDYCY